MLETVLIVLAVALLVMALLVGAVAGRALWVTRSSRRRLRELGGHREVTVLLGHAAAGRDQRPAVGTLVRTDESVVFVPLSARAGTEVHVARADLTTTSTAQSFMGRTFPEPALLLTWDQQGLGDAMALKVSDPEEWIAALA